MRHGINTHVWHSSLYRTLSHLMTFEVKKEREREGGGGGGGGGREEDKSRALSHWGNDSSCW